MLQCLHVISIDIYNIYIYTHIYKEHIGGCQYNTTTTGPLELSFYIQDWSASRVTFEHMFHLCQRMVSAGMSLLEQNLYL